jgi:hypothetical protein
MNMKIYEPRDRRQSTRIYNLERSTIPGRVRNKPPALDPEIPNPIKPPRRIHHPRPLNMPLRTHARTLPPCTAE